MTAVPMEMAADEQQRVLELVRQHPASPRLGAAVLTLMEGAVQAGQVGLRLQRTTIEEALQPQGLVWQDGTLAPGLDVLQALTVGAVDPATTVALEALLALGLGARLRGLQGEALSQALQSWVLLGDHLLVGSPLNPYRYLLPLLDERAADSVFANLAERVAHDLAADGSALLPVARIRAMLRLEVILRILPPQQRDALLARVAAECRSPEARRVLSGYLAAVANLPAVPGTIPYAGEAGAAPRLEGEVQRPARGPLVALLQVLCGWALLRGLAGLIGRYLLGARHRGVLELRGDQVRLERTRTLLGRVVAQREDTVQLQALLGWGVDHRRNAALLLLGVLAFCVGGVVGLFILFDSLRAGFPLFGLVGLLIVGLGITLDLATAAIFDLGAGRSSLWLGLPGQPVLRLSRVPAALARQFVAAIQQARTLPAGTPAPTRTQTPRTAPPVR